MGMRPVYHELSDASGGAKSFLIPMNWRVDDFQATIRAKVTGTVAYSVQYTTDDIRSPNFTAGSADWTALSGMDGATASAEATIVSPVTALRLLLSSGTGSVDFNVVMTGP